MSNELDRRSFLARMLAAAAGLPFMLSQAKATPEVTPKADPQPEQPKPCSASDGGQVTTYPFDSTDRGALTTYCYDATGHVSQIIHPDGKVTRYEYDGSKHLDG